VLIENGRCRRKQPDRASLLLHQRRHGLARNPGEAPRAILSLVIVVSVSQLKLTEIHRDGRPASLRQTMAVATVGRTASHTTLRSCSAKKAIPFRRILLHVFGR